MPALNGTKHTIIGRLFKGKETVKHLEGIQEYRSSQDFIKRRIQSMPMAMGSQMNPTKEEEKVHQDTTKEIRTSRIVIRDSGAYKFERSD